MMAMMMMMKATLFYSLASFCLDEGCMPTTMFARFPRLYSLAFQASAPAVGIAVNFSAFIIAFTIDD